MDEPRRYIPTSELLKDELAQTYNPSDPMGFEIERIFGELMLRIRLRLQGQWKSNE